MTAPRRLGALAAAAAFLLSGCGVIPGTSSSQDPIVVMTWAPENTNATNMPGMPAMAEAYSRMVNAQGGINGRPLQVLTCNEHNDTVQAENCAQQAVNAHAVAVIGSYSQYGESFMPLLENAGIPYIGGYGITQDEFTSPLSYPVNGGLPALLAGNGRQLASGCRRISLVRPDTEAGDSFPQFLDAGLAYGGNPTPAQDVRVPEAATDYTAAARTAVGAGDPGQCVTAVLGGNTGTFFDDFRRLDVGPQIRTASVLGSVDQPMLDAMGGAEGPMEGSYATGWYPPPSDSRWDAMRAAVDKYAFGDTNIDIADPGAETTWIAYTVFATVVGSLGDGDVTASTVQHALDNAHGISTDELTPPLGWQYGDLLAVQNYPRMVNATVTYQVVRDGELSSVGRGGFVNMSQTLERAHD